MTDIEPRPGPREALRRSGMIATPLPGDEADLENIVNPVLARGPDETGVGPEREFTVKARSQSQLVIRRFLRHRPAIISLIVLGLVVFLAFIFAPYIWDYDFKGEPRTLPNIKPTLDLIPWIDGDGLAFGAHPFGTDGIGADYFALTMTGAQKSLQIALLVVVRGHRARGAGRRHRRLLPGHGRHPADALRRPDAGDPVHRHRGGARPQHQGRRLVDRGAHPRPSPSG